MPRKKKLKTLGSQLKALYIQYKQPIRGFLGWVGGLVIQVVTQAGGPDEVQNWNRHRWILALIAAAIPGVAMWMRGGEKPQTAEEVASKVAYVDAMREQKARGGSSSPPAAGTGT